MKKPLPFLTTRVHEVSSAPGLSGLCVGYERNLWRYDALVDHTMKWIPEFALKESERNDIGIHNCVDMLKKAAKKIYSSSKFRNRGEFGELFLHIATRQLFDSIPVISKIYYKSSRNDTVKGFDAVHIVESVGGEFELWLGESKFYKDAKAAIRDVVKELVLHTQVDFLRDEFVVITDYLDDTSSFSSRLKSLISHQSSMDEIFSRVCIPVFLTYESKCVASHKRVSVQYAADFENEIREVYAEFASKSLPSELRIHLFLMPLHEKEELVAALDRRLRVWQEI